MSIEIDVTELNVSSPYSGKMRLSFESSKALELGKMAFDSMTELEKGEFSKYVLSNLQLWQQEDLYNAMRYCRPLS